MILTKEEKELVLRHRHEVLLAKERAAKQKACKHLNTGNWVSGHNSWLGDCLDCGALVER